jgi:hypothetical protein
MAILLGRSDEWCLLCGQQLLGASAGASRGSGIQKQWHSALQEKALCSAGKTFSAKNLVVGLIDQQTFDDKAVWLIR